MASEKTENGSENNLKITFLSNTSHKSLSTARLHLPSLQYRHLRGDLILLYRMYHNDLEINFTDYFTTSHVTFTRGHSCKLFKPHAISRARANFFSVRIIDLWNNLPNFIIQAHSITVFKNLLDNHCSDLMYNYAS